MIPLVALITVIVMRLADNVLNTSSFVVLSPTVVGIGCASFILALVQGAPEARRFESQWLRFLGRISYSTYLIHIPVLELMHGAVLGTKPDLTHWSQLALSLAALPIVIFGGWFLTRVVEEPITAYGRSFRWSPGQARGSLTIGASDAGSVAGSEQRSPIPTRAAGPEMAAVRRQAGCDVGS